MNNDVIITCAVTGAGDTVGKHPAIPVTPQQIADSAIEAAKAGAAIVHIHVRDPETGKGSRRTDLYREVVHRIRGSSTDVIINLTSGMGGDAMINDSDPFIDGPNSDLAGPTERVVHLEELRPEICSLDCATMNFGEGVFLNAPSHLRIMAKLIRQWGIKPELEVFDLGHVRRADHRIARGQGRMRGRSAPATRAEAARGIGAGSRGPRPSHHRTAAGRQ